MFEARQDWLACLLLQQSCQGGGWPSTTGAISRHIGAPAVTRIASDTWYNVRGAMVTRCLLVVQGRDGQPRAGGGGGGGAVRHGRRARRGAPFIGKSVYLMGNLITKGGLCKLNNKLFTFVVQFPLILLFLAVFVLARRHGQADQHGARVQVRKPSVPAWRQHLCVPSSPYPAFQQGAQQTLTSLCPACTKTQCSRYHMKALQRPRTVAFIQSAGQWSSWRACTTAARCPALLLCLLTTDSLRTASHPASATWTCCEQVGV